jgi:hypothetical protein
MQGRKNSGIVVKRKERCMSNDFTGEMEERLSDLPDISHDPVLALLITVVVSCRMKFRKSNEKLRNLT